MENSYKKVWINKEWKTLIKRGIDKVSIALDWLEHSLPGCSDRYYARSPQFRRKVAEQAGSLRVSTFRIYCWLKDLLTRKHNGPIPPLVPDGQKERNRGQLSAVKEAASHERKAENRKETSRFKDRKVRNCIPSHVARNDDYINGVKYRVIVYFGRNVK